MPEFRAVQLLRDSAFLFFRDEQIAPGSPGLPCGGSESYYGEAAFRGLAVEVQYLRLIEWVIIMVNSDVTVLRQEGHKNRGGGDRKGRLFPR